MKYWLLTTEYPPFYGGGISTYCYHTAKMLSQRGNVVSVFVNDSSINDVEIDSDNRIRVIRFNPNRTNSSSFLGHVTNISYEFAHIVKYFIESEGKPDIIESQEYLGIAYYLLQYKHLQYDWCKEIPVLITMHSPAFLYLEYNHVPLFKYPNFWIGEMERFSIQAADVVVSPSHFLINEVEKRLEYNHNNFFVVPNPFEFKETELIIDPGNEGDIVFFGKLSVQKGTFQLLHYFKRMWEHGFSEPLLLIGGQDIVYHPEGKTMGEIVRKQYKNFINKGLLRLENPIAPSNVRQRLASAKVVIIPSLVDNLPYVVMEMMSQGLIVLVSKQGGQAEIVTDGIDGFVFDHDDPLSFPAQLEYILELTNEQRCSISKKAIERISGVYNLQAIFENKSRVIQLATNNDNDFISFPFIRKRDLISDLDLPSESIKNMLSIVIPYYNMGEYVDETITSIMNTDVELKELIIINDGSTHTKSIAQLNIYRNNPICRVIDIPNQGLANARNYGAKMSKGEFLAFLDADDLVAPDYFSKSIKVLRKYKNVHFVGAWTQYFGESKKAWATFTPEPPLILFHNLINSSALVYKRNSFLTAGLNDAKMPFQGLEDYESVISLVQNGLFGVVLPELLFYYRVRNDSMIRGVSNVKKTILYDYISRKHKSYYACYASELFSLTTSNGTGTVLDNPSKDFSFLHKFPFNNSVTRTAVSYICRKKHLKKLFLSAYGLFSK